MYNLPDGVKKYMTDEYRQMSDSFKKLLDFYSIKEIEKYLDSRKGKEIEKNF
jgi:hypothetical protein